MKLSRYLLGPLAITMLYGASCTTTINNYGPPPPPPDLAMKPPPDLVQPDLMVDSCCGFPGDPGNSLGVGKYCTDSSGCAGNPQATFCSSLSNTPQRKTYFCTMPCMPVDGGMPCGENAWCYFDRTTMFYGCIPIVCLASPPSGCMW